MNTFSHHYETIEKAILFLQENHRLQPKLEEVADHVHMSPTHFQKLFSEWAGTSPKKFLQYLNIHHAKQLLTRKNATLFDVSYDIGLSSTSRLHDLFISIEGMTPADYKNGGENLDIYYQYSDTPFGQVIVASTDKGICHLSFYTHENESLSAIKQQFPKATFHLKRTKIQESALQLFHSDEGNLSKIKLHLKGTPFQLKVWEALLRIPSGKLSTYGKIAETIQHAKAVRAVGTAIGKNPVAFLIPCHRVIQNSGLLGGYMWGITRKTAIIGWESAKNDNTLD